MGGEKCGLCVCGWGGVGGVSVRERNENGVGCGTNGGDAEGIY